MKRKAHIILLVLLLLCVLSTTAFAIDESEVESAIAASSKEEVAGNVFIWFLCAIGFLKVSQKIDSFMASLGINVGRTGGSMLTELMVAGRGIAAVAGAVGGTVFNHHSSSNSTHTNAQAAGAAFTGGGNGLVGVTRRAAGNAAAASATGNAKGLSNLVGGAMFESSLQNGGKFAMSVVGAVAKGSIWRLCSPLTRISSTLLLSRMKSEKFPLSKVTKTRAKPFMRPFGSIPSPIMEKRILPIRSSTCQTIRNSLQANMRKT